MDLKNIHRDFKVNQLQGRYITSEMLKTVLDGFGTKLSYDSIGHSVEKRPIFSITLGTGKTKVLMWSQMHGNESTTTKALTDFISVGVNSNAFTSILKEVTLCIIPILNPDGANNYTRVNANKVDLNRDAQDQSQPESKILMKVFNDFKPHFCFNLHGQRTIFGAGDSGNPASLSFLSPAEDKTRMLTPTRKKAMAIINAMLHQLNNDIKSSVGRYDDGFNINCVGDTFQQFGVPTVLFEAGHFPNDYQRETSRYYIFEVLVFALQYIAKGVNTEDFKGYFDIPENKKNFYDVIIKNALVTKYSPEVMDIAIQFKEELTNNKVVFKPIVEKIEPLSNFYAHKIIQAYKTLVLKGDLKPISIGNEIDFIIINGKNIVIKP